LSGADEFLDSNKTTEHKEPFIKRIFDHHHDNVQENTVQADNKDGVSNHQSNFESLKSGLKKDEEGLENYYQDDKALEEEGETYGGLM